MSRIKQRLGDLRKEIKEQDEVSVDELDFELPNLDEKYDEYVNQFGQPDAGGRDYAVWFGPDPWKRTVFNPNTASEHHFPKPHLDTLEQTIDYDVPHQYLTLLAEFDGSVSYSRTRGELSARCDFEAANFLALNLAVSIIDGERTVEEARRDYAEFVVESMTSDTNPGIMQEFQFDLTTGDTGDLDKINMTEDQLREIGSL